MCGSSVRTGRWICWTEWSSRRRRCGAGSSFGGVHTPRAGGSGPLLAREEQRGGSTPHQQCSSARRTGKGAHRTAHHHVQIRSGEGGFGAFHIAAPWTTAIRAQRGRTNGRSILTLNESGRSPVSPRTTSASSHSPTTWFLTVGLPGAGKTTRARQLAKEHSALRLTPDEWMIPLFGEPEADGKRDVLEGRLLSLARGASCHLVHVPVDHETQRARIAHRRSTTPDQTFPMSEADLLHRRTLFEEPDSSELDGHEIDGPPPGWSGWLEWATERWPSFP